MPVYNEPHWLRRSLLSLVEEIGHSPWADDHEIVVVDDGSTDQTPIVLDEFARAHSHLSVVRQDNGGRMAARTAGLERATGRWILFIDSRILIQPGSLAFAAGQIPGGARVWNGHVDVSVEGNRYAQFWDALVKLAWSEYFGDPRTTSYGLAEFDRYPKGTTLFLAPRDVLVRAWSAFTTYYADTRTSNDDTSVIRHVAGQEPIWLSPSFACHYACRQSFRQFLRHARARGTVFVDGHLRRDARFAPIIVAFYPLSVAAVLTAYWAWWGPPMLLLVAALGAGAVCFHRLDRTSGTAVLLLAPPFTVSFGLGMWKGAALAARQRFA